MISVLQIIIIVIALYVLYTLYVLYNQYQFNKFNNKFIYSLVESLEQSPNFTPASGFAETKAMMKAGL